MSSRSSGSARGPNRLVLWAAGIGVAAAIGCAALYALLDAFDAPTALLRWARPWIQAEMAAVDPVPAAPRWQRVVKIGPYASPPSADALVRLLDRLEPGAAPGVERQSLSLDGVHRAAAVGGPAHAFAIDAAIPPDGRLWMSLDRRANRLSTGGTRFRVTVDAGAAPAVVFDEVLPAWHVGWKNVEVDLSRYATDSARLDFEASPVGPGDPDPATRVYWGDLALRSASDRAKPDIVVLLIDTLRADHLGCYGYARDTSPYLDRLASEGARFSRVIASAPWTNPSVLSILTGLYPRDVWEPAPHAEAITKSLPESVDTLAARLARQGYFTLAASDHPGISSNRFGAGFDAFAALYFTEGVKLDWRKTGAATLLRRLSDVVAQRGAGPTFLYLHVLYPHQPLEPPPGYLEAVGAADAARDPDPQIAAIARYDAEIRVADDVVAQSRALLVAAGFRDDMVLVVLADHGEGFGEHGFEEHGNTLYNELLHVPLIVHAPGRVPAGLVIDDLVGHVDVLPTVLALAGAVPPDGIRGRDALTGGSHPDRLAYSEFPHTRIVEAYAVQSADEKWIHGDPQLADGAVFDLASDPLERTPQVTDPSVAERLRVVADEIRSAAAHPVAAGPEDTEAQTQEMLENLGYAR